MKSYSELITIPTFEERFRYLCLGGVVGEETFGFERYLNQVLYSSYKWKHDVRPSIVIRDDDNDMAFPDMPISGRIIVHHINPISIDDIRNRSKKLFDPDNLVCVSFNTHQAITYGSENLLQKDFIERTPGDTCLWR